MASANTKVLTDFYNKKNYTLPSKDPADIAATQAKIRENIAAHAARQSGQNGGGEVTTSSAGGGGGVTGGNGNAQSYIDQLAQYQRDQAIAGLGKARDNALSNLNSERSAIAPKYYDQRNQAAAGSQQQARNFAEFMAARGGTSSGANAQGELTRGMTLQSNLGSLGRQEAQAFTDIERRMSDVNNAYESDIASANAGAESQRMQALLNDYYQQQQRELDIAGLTGMLGQQRTLAGQGFDRGILESDRNYGRGVLESDRNYDRGVLESDRTYDQTVTANEWSRYVDNQQLNQWERQFEEDKRQYGQDYAMRQVAAKASQARGSSGGGGSSGSGTKPPSIAQLLEIWRLTGQAPEGIPGVTPGIKPYDKDAAAKAEKEANSFWGVLKGVLGGVGKAITSANGVVSDEDISEYTNN